MNFEIRCEDIQAQATPVQRARFSDAAPVPLRDPVSFTGQNRFLVKMKMA